MKISYQKGFTLIELLVVISIIGVLSSVVMASMNIAKLKAKDAAVKSALAQMELLLHQEYADTGTYRRLQAKNWNDGYTFNCDNVFPPDSIGG
jgi:prepilin-type N-terminal cleavage/methylation domain-containing protein